MLSIENKNLIFLKFFKDENVNEQIKNACRIHKVKTAVIISSIGQLKNVQLGYFKEKVNYLQEKFDKLLEILLLNGNICHEKDEYSIHMHIVLSDENKNALKGHFIDGTISGTGEIELLKTEFEVKRKNDEETGLKMLYFW